jgi:hypothetical protein
MKSNAKFPRMKAIVALGICSSLLMAKPGYANPVNVKGIIPVVSSEDPVKKADKKISASLNNSSVKIFPDAWRREMHLVAKNNDGKIIDFFVFDVEGTLVQNYRLKAKDHFKMSGLARGTYVYRVFCGDEETASGKFIIR